MEPSFVAEIVERLPPKLPIGVLTAYTITTSFILMIFKIIITLANLVK